MNDRASEQRQRFAPQAPPIPVECTADAVVVPRTTPTRRRKADMLTPRKHLLPATLLTLALVASAASAVPRHEPGSGGNLRNPGVLPPGSSPYGKSYAEWSAEHWK